MPAEIEELVEFLHHGNTQIRQVACENLVQFSKTEPSIFKTHDLAPIKDLKLLVKDYGPIAKNALTILVNIAGDGEVLQSLVTDDAFVETLLFRITNPKEPNANEMGMLLANMTKDKSLSRLITLKRSPPLGLSKSELAFDHLLDVFVRGATGTYNAAANYDYLAYVFADLAQYLPGATHLCTAQPYDDVVPLDKLLPFLTHPALPRRLGVAGATKNAALVLATDPAALLAPRLDLVPALLRPLMSGADRYADAETERLPEPLQLLEPAARREPDARVLAALLETLLVLAGARAGRERLRAAGCYYVVRECHLAVEDEGVREACDRLVQVLMRDEEGEEASGEATGGATAPSTQAEGSDDEDDKIVEIF